MPVLRSGFWRWLCGRGCAPKWLVVKVDHAMIRQAKQEALEAEKWANR